MHYDSIVNGIAYEQLNELKLWHRRLTFDCDNKIIRMTIDEVNSWLSILNNLWNEFFLLKKVLTEPMEASFNLLFKHSLRSRIFQFKISILKLLFRWNNCQLSCN